MKTKNKTKISTWKLLNRSCLMNKRRESRRKRIVASILAISVIFSLITIKVAQIQAHGEQDMLFADNVSVSVPKRQEGGKFQEISPKEWVLNEVKKAGLDPQEADTIIQCESNWNEWGQNVNNNHTTDSGIWMINSIHKGTISLEDRFDYKKSTRWAIEKRLKDGNWSAWVCSRLRGIK